MCIPLDAEAAPCVLALIQDRAGRTLITHRSADKRWAAGWWEVPGGGVLAGETSLQAVVREVREEVGLDVAGAACELLYSYSNEDPAHADNYFADIYRFELDFSVADVVLQESEAVSCMAATWAEIEALNEKGVFLHFARLERALRPAVC